MHFFTDYILPFIILILAELLYFKVARHGNIIDKPNDRSSHHVPTIRGGGVIFLLAVLLFYLWKGYNFPYLLMAMLVSGIISFTDDMRTLPNRLKFSSHIISVILIFRECGILTSMSPLYLTAIGILVIGVINAYNFMDGINGMTGLYSLSVVVPLCITEQNETIRSLELFSIMGLVAFNFFNTRKRAVCFAGDVGSISMAILIVFLVIVRVQETSNFAFTGLLLIYGIDSIYTIVQRLIQKENIFKPHRKHLYQYLSNEKKIPQLWVSSTFALVQLLINYTIVYGYLNYWGLIIIFLVLSLFYWLIKAPFLIFTRV